MTTNSQECQNLIQNINSAIEENPGLMKNPEEQYKQRKKYIEVLEYALKNNELYHLYDIWQVFSKAKEEATRGFFLDLWDIYNRQEGKNKNQREREILRDFVCRNHDQFYEILDTDRITAPNLWQEYVSELLTELMWIENEQEKKLQRKLLYSMSHLYVFLYPDTYFYIKKEKECLIRQLQITKKAIHCCKEENNSSIVLAEIFSDNQHRNLVKDFTCSFLYLCRFVNHYGVICLKDFVTKVINSLKTEEFIHEIGETTGKELLGKLLRYWGANAPLMKFFLREKLDFQFNKYYEKEVQLPSAHGTDHYVYTIGAFGVGKTNFFQAMEYSSNKNDEDEKLPLLVEYIDISQKEGRLERQKWKKGEKLTIKENHLIYMRSKVRNLCRFTFLKIEDTQIIGNSTIAKWQSIERYFERYFPSVIILMFSTREPEKIQSYEVLVNSLIKLAQKDDRYLNIPIYFLFNKSDQLLRNIKNQTDNRKIFNEFNQYLNSEIKFSDKLKFFSLRYLNNLDKFNILEIADQTQECCKNLAFSNQLTQDITKISDIVNSFLAQNFTNLSFTYTCSLFQNDNKYSDLRNLWSDINNFIIRATCQDIEQYYRREFQTKLDNDFLQVELFCKEAIINTSILEFSKDIFDSLNKAPESDKMKQDFDNLIKKFEKNNKIDTKEISHLLSGFEDNLDDFFEEKEYLSKYLNKLLRVILRELNIPIEHSQYFSKEKQNHKDFLVSELIFIEPEIVNNYDDIWQFYVKTQSVKNFVETEDYKTRENEIKESLWQTINDYNKSQSEQDQIRIDYKKSLQLITEQLPKLLEIIDLANKNKILETSIKEKLLFSRALNNTNALCKIQCGQFEQSEKNLIRGNIYEQTVFSRLDELIDSDLENAQKYCQLLSNYLPEYPQKPKYPQFIILNRHHSQKIQVELNEIKINVLNNLNNELEQINKLLINMVKILLENKRELDKISPNLSNQNEDKNYLFNLYLAQYLLKILDSSHFNINQFQKQPQETIQQISLVCNKLVEIMNTRKSTSDETETDLESFRKDYQQIKLGDYLSSLNTRDISTKGKEIEIELETVLDIYQQIWNLVRKDQDKLESLSTEIIQTFSFLRINEYNNLVQNYERQRKFIIAKERLKYLQTSKWIEKPSWLNNLFKREPNDLFTPDTEKLNKWKLNFIQFIDQILDVAT